MRKCLDEQFEICINNSRCFICDGSRLFKRPKWMETKEKQQKKKAAGIKKKEKDGMKFEKTVAKTFNEAKRCLNSGAMWFNPGDITTPEALIECKLRGSKTSRGAKTFTIEKEQLTKIRDESILAKKNEWYYVFGFKEDTSIYLIKDFEAELSMLQYIQQLEEKLLEKGENDA